MPKGNTPRFPSTPTVEPLDPSIIPGDLDDDARAEWQRIAPLLEWLGECDRQPLTDYVRCVANASRFYRMAVEATAPKDIEALSRSHRGNVEQARKLGVLLGIGPASRAHFQAPEGETTDPKAAKLREMIKAANG